MKNTDKYNIMGLAVYAIAMSFFFLNIYNITLYLIILLISVFIGYRKLRLIAPKKRKKELLTKGIALGMIGMFFLYFYIKA